MMKIKVALAGNPNTGKTTIFNNLTGARQFVGNWPGVTVEKKVGFFKCNEYEVEVVDLPGIYSLSASTIDEKIARDFILNESPDLVVCVVDASNLERNLYLVVQLLEMGTNVMMDLNMVDIAESRGLKINTGKLSKCLGIPVVKTVGHKNLGTDVLKKTMISAIQKITAYVGCHASYPHRHVETHTAVEYNPVVEKVIGSLSGELKRNNVDGNARWLAVKLLEEDQYVMQELKAHVPNLEELVISHVTKLEKNLSVDVATLIANARYDYIKQILDKCVEKVSDRRFPESLTDKIDAVVINRVFGLPIFLLVTFLTFKFVFAVGDPLVSFIDWGFGALGELVTRVLSSAGASPALISFLTDGVIGGVGAVLVFLPNIMLLFFAISFLEDTGYMARGAFVMDRIMRVFGLHGKSFIPMMLGFGCNVPAIMATRTLESRKDRILTILVNPLMSCSARLPIYVLFASVFFPRRTGTVVFSLYILGIVLAILMARVFKTLFFKEESPPLIMELPPYRLPQLKTILLQTWTRSKAFLIKAGTIIFAATVVVWLLSTFPLGVEYGSRESFIGVIGRSVAPILKPAGFGFWQAGVALLFGLIAKEVVVSTLGTLLGGEESLPLVLSEYFNPVSAYAFMVMSLVYIPCIATIATIKRETSWKWTLLAIGYSLVLGWILAVVVYKLGGLIFNI
ncbi:MAG: ferrous iron transport protein B [Thermotogae bacterium]|nr:ferrous iron transport protein B [Thermotogota bacterium]